MADYSRRKSTVREALGMNVQAAQRVNAGKLRGRYLFRAAVRLVIEYADWIGDDSLDQIGDNVTANVKLARRKKPSESDLTIKERSALLTPPDKRSRDDVGHIRLLIQSVKAFKRYPEDIRESLAAECRYQYLPPGRTVIRQGHKAWMLYYVVQGELQIFCDVTENFTGDVSQSEVGLLKPGDMFGEIALLHKVPRTATVVSKTGVDLLVVTRHVFNEHLRNYLMEEWDVLRDAFVNFNYFKGWSEETMRECCIISKIMNFKPNEILLGDGRGMVHYVYFLLAGECRLIEHLLVEKESTGQQVKCKLYDAQEKGQSSRQRPGRSKIIDLASEDDLESLMFKNISRVKSDGNIAVLEQSSTADELIKLISAKKDNVNIAMERISVITVTLQDTINQWHEITDAVEMLMKKPSVTSLNKYPGNVHTVFMQICTFYRGACFGLGEEMKNRRIVSITPTKCLLIPRFWLTQHNRANIWERVKHFMNSKYPSNKQLFDKYMNNKMWAKHKKRYIDNLVKEGRNLPNNTKYYDVPYSIRINDTIGNE